MSPTHRDVFISYHTSSSEQLVETIAAALEARGISCWYAFRDAHHAYPEAIVDALQNCRLFLLVLNEHSNKAAHVHNEIGMAFDRVNRGEDITILPFRMDHCPLNANVYYYLTRIRMMDGSLPPEVQRIQELVGRIAHLLDMEPQSRSAQLFTSGNPAPQTYRIVGSSTRADNHFVGRQQELQQLHEKLSDADNKVFLIGMGGIGKSEIAKKYLQLHSEDYDILLWVSFAESLEKTIGNDYAFSIQGLQKSDFPEDTPRDYFLRKLNIFKQLADRRVLVVMDNFDVTDDPDLELFCSGGYSVIFTTRYHPLDDRYETITVSSMVEEADLLALVKTEYTRPLKPADMDTLRKLFTLLDNHTLSVRLAASAMQKQRLQPQKLLELLESGCVAMQQSNAKASDLIYGKLKQVFLISALTEEELFLMKNLALIPLRGIDVSLLYEWCELEDYELIDELVRKSWVIYNSDTDEVHLHPMIAQIMTEALQQDPECCNAFLAHLGNIVDNWQFTTYEEKLQYSDYAFTAYRNLPRNSPQYRKALYQHAEFVKELKSQIEALALYEELAAYAETSEDVLKYKNRISHSHSMAGDPQKSFDVALEAYESVAYLEETQWSRTFGNQVVALLHRLCESTRALGRLEESIAYGRKAVALSPQFYNTSPEGTTGWSIYHLAASLIRSGEIEEAENLLLEAARLFEQINDPWSMSFTLDQLAQISMKNSQYEEALSRSKKASSIMAAHTGQKHRNQANSLMLRADIYFAMGDIAQGNACCTEAAEIFTLNRYPAKAAEALAKCKKV